MNASAFDWESSTIRENAPYAILSFLQDADGVSDQHALFRIAHRALSAEIACDRMSIGQVDRVTHSVTTLWQTGASLGLPDGYETLPTDSRSLTHAVVRDGVTVVHTVPEHHDVYRGDSLRRRSGLRHVLVAPMRRDGVTTGVLKLYRFGRAPFSKDDAATAETLARALGLALDHLPTRQREHDHRAEQDMVNVIARLLRADSEASMHDQLLETLAANTGAAILRFDAQDDGLEHVASRNVTAALVKRNTPEVLRRLLTTRVDAIARYVSESVPRTTFFTDSLDTGDSRLPVLAMGLFADSIEASAVACTLMQRAGAMQTVILAAWPPDVAPRDAARQAECMDTIVESIEPALSRLVELERMRVEIAELDTIRRLTDTIARTPRMHDALELICRSTQLMTGLAFVAVAETVTDHVVWRAAAGAHDTSFLHKRLPVPPRILSDLLMHRQEILLDDVRQDPDLTPEIMPVHTREQLRSTVVLPVQVNAKLRAAMIASQRHLHAFEDAELSLLHALAGTVATAIAANDARLSEREDD